MTTVDSSSPVTTETTPEIVIGSGSVPIVPVVSTTPPSVLFVPPIEGSEALVPIRTDVVPIAASQLDKRDLRAIVAQTLGIVDDDAWRIIDTDNDLVMVHYELPRADLANFGWLRGVVVDIKKGIKVADSYGSTPTAVAEAIIPDAQGNITFTEAVSGVVHSVPVNQSIIKYGLEGVMIRVFKWGNKVYFVSHRRFDISRSRWGNSLPFLTIYNTRGGPAGSQLYSEAEQYSPYIHYFMVSHPKILHVTKDQVGGGFIYYLGYRQMWSLDPAQSPFRMTDEQGNPLLTPGQSLDDWQKDPRPVAGWVSHQVYFPANLRSTVPTFEEEAALAAAGQSPGIILPPNLTVPQANTLLRYGYQTYDDPNADLQIEPRLRTGEFVMLYKPDGTLLRIESPSYYWRARITDDNPNRANQFYYLTTAATRIQPVYTEANQARLRFELERFRQVYPPMTPYAIKSIKAQLQNGPILVWDTRHDGNPHYEEISTVNDRIYNIWAALFMASPPNRQDEVVELYERYYRERGQLIRWIIELSQLEQRSSSIQIDNSDEYNPRLQSIIDRAQRSATTNSSHQSRNPQKLSYNQLFQQAVSELVQREPGNILYTLVKEMKHAQRLAAEMAVREATAEEIATV